MNFKIGPYMLAVLLLPLFAGGQSANVNLSDLLSPDDVMLRKPTSAASAEAAAAKARAEEQSRKEAAEMARKEAEAAAAKARAEEQARKEAEEKARREAEAAAAKARAEEQARKEAEERVRREAEEKARKEEAEAAAKAETDKKARKKKKLTAQTLPDGEGARGGAGTQGGRRAGSQGGRDAVITAERTDYDRKEGVILFDRNVFVDDEQYQLHADRLFLFLDGTNDLKRLVAIGHVAITNEEKNAACSRAVYTKSTSKIVMYGAENEPASLYQGGKRGSTVKGERITFWLNSEQVEIEKPVVTVPGGSFKGGDAKGLFKNMK